MNFLQWVENYLDNEIMLFPDAIAGVTQAFVESPVNEAMAGRWTAAIDGYPPQLMVAMKFHLNTICLEWLKEHMPKHFMIRYLEELHQGVDAAA